MKNIFLKSCLAVLIFTACSLTITAQPGNAELMSAIKNISTQVENLSHEFDILQKKIDDIYWYNKVGDVAYIDKVYITGPPLAVEMNPTGQGAGNPVKFWTYIFIPKDADPAKKYPVITYGYPGKETEFLPWQFCNNMVKL